MDDDPCAAERDLLQEKRRELRGIEDQIASGELSDDERERLRRLLPTVRAERDGLLRDFQECQAAHGRPAEPEH